MLRRVLFLNLFIILNICWADQPVAKTIVYGGITPGVQGLENGKESGPALPPLKMLLQQSGIDYEFRVTNWAQTHKRFSTSKESLIFALSRHSGREERFQWVVPLAQLDLRLARSKHQPHLNPKSFEDLKNYKLAVVRGAATQDLLIDLGFVEGQDYGTVSNSKELLKYMKTGFVEFVFYESTISPLMLELFSLPPDYLVPIDVEVLENDAIWLAATLDFPAQLIEKIRTTHQRLLNNEEYQALLLKILPKSRKNPDFDMSGKPKD